MVTLSFQVSKGLLPPVISMCRYNHFSIPTMWNLVQPEGGKSPSPEYERLKATSSQIYDLILRMMYVRNKDESKIDDLTLYHNVKYTIAEMMRKSMLLSFTLLKNTPNMSFEQIFDKLGEDKDNIIHACQNGLAKCKDFTQFSSGQFPRCFRYGTSRDIENMEMDDGISNAIMLILMTGGQLMSVAHSKAYRKASSIHRRVPNDHLFGHVYSPSSSNGIRLTISRPGVNPNIDEGGIDVSPGYHTVISVTA